MITCTAGQEDSRGHAQLGPADEEDLVEGGPVECRRASFRSVPNILSPATCIHPAVRGEISGALPTPLKPPHSGYLCGIKEEGLCRLDWTGLRHEPWAQSRSPRPRTTHVTPKLCSKGLFEESAAPPHECALSQLPQGHKPAINYPVSTLESILFWGTLDL